MKKAIIAIDIWKLPVFERILKEEKYEYSVNRGITSDTLLITVHFNMVAELQPVIQKANDECAKNKAKLMG